MPHLRIETNLPRAKVPADLVKTLGQVVAKTLDKPANIICVTILPDLLQSFGGGDDPSCQVTLMAIGNLGQQENIKHSKVIFEAVHKGLGIDPTRMYVHFQDVKSQDVGFNGTTFYEILGK